MEADVLDDRFTLLAPGGGGEARDLAREVELGLRATPKRIPCRFFYDETGSALFEEICALPEYYLTRAEDEILARHAAEIAAAPPAGCDLVELGSGSARKTLRLIEPLLAREGSLVYAPIDISRAALLGSARSLLSGHPGLSIRAVEADYEAGWSALFGGLEHRGRDGRGDPPRNKLVLWLGSNVGNLDREAAAGFLGRLSGRLSPRDRLLVGIDLRKDPRVLEAAYDDARGVTARFNRNLLARVNAELDADFDPAAFRHVALYDERAGRIEMHLESARAQAVRIEKLGANVRFAAGERIHTEDSYKYSRAEIEELARRAKLGLERTWLDSEKRFSLCLLAPRH